MMTDMQREVQREVIDLAADHAITRWVCDSCTIDGRAPRRRASQYPDHRCKAVWRRRDVMHESTQIMKITHQNSKTKLTRCWSPQSVSIRWST
eukprot:9400336-Pyramimonas_sp.AAC.1